MHDRIGKLPKVRTKKEVLEEILRIAEDKRTHLLLVDCNAWLELKLRAIRKLAKKGLEL